MDLHQSNLRVLKKRVCSPQVNGKAGIVMEQSAQEQKKLSMRQEIFEWLETIVVAIIGVVLLFTFVLRTCTVEGESMLETLQPNDLLIVTHLFYTPEQGDIVVITQPTSVGAPLIKRIIATEGQTITVDYENNCVYVDGHVLNEPYVWEAMQEPSYSDGEITYPYVVPEGCVFVMGDNRNNSMDSRAEGIGVIDTRYIMGKAVLRLAPFSTFGWIE